jgi:hypothetical protein
VGVRVVGVEIDPLHRAEIELRGELPSGIPFQVGMKRHRDQRYLLAFQDVEKISSLARIAAWCDGPEVEGL